jgi:hypothetical protein
METSSQDVESPGRNTQLILQMMSQMSEQLQALRAERENDREAVQAQIQVLQSAIATPTATPQPPVVRPEPIRPGSAGKAVKKKPTLPDPQRFDGNRRRFRTWQLEMQSKLRVDGPAIGSPFDQFAYIYARLDQTPQGMAAAFFEKGAREDCYTPDQFMEYLVTCYGDPNSQQRAMSRLETMRQKDKESFAAFLPKFEKELSDSGGATWDNLVRINSLKRAINPTLRAHLVGQLNLPTTYSEYVNALQNLGANLDEHRLYGGRNQHQNPPQPQQSNHGESKHAAAGAPSPDPMDWEGTKLNAAGSDRRAKWASAEELQRRKDERACLRCGSDGHFIGQCKLKPAIPPTKASRTRARTGEESSGEGSGDSGKE